jgi:acetyltransferase-like isoleucine patch superfamily enzyme
MGSESRPKRRAPERKAVVRRGRHGDGPSKWPCYSTFRETDNPPPGSDQGTKAAANGAEGLSGNETQERRQVSVQAELRRKDRSAFAKYQDLVVGSRSLGRLLLYELVALFTSWVPGALGLVLRKLCYPTLLGACGRNVTFGQGVVLRHPHKIRIGHDVVVDDGVLLDAKGEHNKGIALGDSVFLGRGSILSCKDGDITLADHVNLGFNCEIFSGSTVTVGRHGLFAAYVYLVGGGHEFERAEVPVLEQGRSSRGIALDDNVWLGTGAKVLDGVRIGKNVVVGANAVVNTDLPDGVIAAGVPARVIRDRGEGA